MPKFTAVTSKGLRDLLQDELVELGFSGVKPNGSTVDFTTNWEGCFRANACSRIATRILYPVLDFPAYQPEELYHNILKHDFTQYIDPIQTFMINSSVDQSSFRDQRFVSMKVKDAIADQFRDKHGARPSVDKENPDLKIMVRILKNQVSVAIDTSGRSLAMRGYRSDQGEAPLREHLAAGLLRRTGWRPGVPLLDPMCGSGTFLLEAMLVQQGFPPSILDDRFSFCGFKKFRDRAWPDVDGEANPEQSELWGFDRNPMMVTIARQNQENLELKSKVKFSVANATTLESPCKEPGILIVNPPFGERLDEVADLKGVYERFSANLKENFKGWTLWLLSGNPELSLSLKMKASDSFKVSNGPIECAFLRYDIR